jgi:hypothetical protein
MTVRERELSFGRRSDDEPDHQRDDSAGEYVQFLLPQKEIKNNDGACLEKAKRFFSMKRS